MVLFRLQILIWCTKVIKYEGWHLLTIRCLPLSADADADAIADASPLLIPFVRLTITNRLPGLPGILLSFYKLVHTSQGWKFKIPVNPWLGKHCFAMNAVLIESHHYKNTINSQVFNSVCERKTFLLRNHANLGGKKYFYSFKNIFTFKLIFLVLKLFN